MAGAYSQDVPDRVIDAVIGGKMSRRAVWGEPVVGRSSGFSASSGPDRAGPRQWPAISGSRWSRAGEFLAARRVEKPDITLTALCEKLLTERGVKADTSMMSRFLRRIGVTLKQRR